MLYQLSYFRDLILIWVSPLWVSPFCGQGRIRTAEAVRQQIYSLPVLTTYLPTRSFRLFYVYPYKKDVTRTGFKPVTF